MNMWSRISTLQLRFIKFIELHSSTGEIDSIQLFFVSSRQFSTPRSLVQWLQVWNHQHYHHCRRRHNHEIWMGLDSREILIFLTLWWNDTPHPTKQTFPHLVSEYQQQHSHSIQTFWRDAMMYSYSVFVHYYCGGGRQTERASFKFLSAEWSISIRSIAGGGSWSTRELHP